MRDSMYNFYKEYRDFALTNPHCSLDQWHECFADSHDLQPSEQVSCDDGDKDEKECQAVKTIVQTTYNDNEHEKFFKMVKVKLLLTRLLASSETRMST
jgi:hypothetical protein